MKEPCEFCGDTGCLRSESWRPSTARIGEVEFDTCGRYLPAGEYIAVQRGKFAFAYCRKCMWQAIRAGVPGDEFIDGALAHCIPCGYHSARLMGVEVSEAA